MKAQRKNQSSSLSPREMEVLEMASEGLLDKEISPKLGITTNTLRTYWTRIREKTGQSSKAGIIASFAKERALQDLPQEVFEPDWDVDLRTGIWRARSNNALPVSFDFGDEAPLEVVLALIHPDDAPQMRQLLQSVAETNIKFFVYRMRIITPTGLMEASAFVKVVRDESGAAIQLIGKRTPVHDFQNTKIEELEVGHWERDLNSLKLTGDASFHRIMGIDEAVHDLREAALARFHPDDQELTRNFVAEAVAQGKKWARANHRVINEGGAYRWVATDMRIEYDAHGKAIRAYGTIMALS